MGLGLGVVTTSPTRCEGRKELVFLEIVEEMIILPNFVFDLVLVGHFIPRVHG